MGAEEKNRNEILSRIAADLFVKSKGGEELSSKIHRLRDEIKKVIENDDTIFGKFRGLVDSFREVIPEEKQRYHAAIKALSATSKISRQELVKAINNQIEELKILEKVLLSAPSSRRDELNVMEIKSREMRDEISKLRERIGRLESEEKEIFNSMAERKKEAELAEKVIGEVFTNIAAEITSVCKKIEEYSPETAVTQAIRPVDSLKSNIPKSEILGEEKKDVEQKSDVPLSSSTQDTETKWQKKCPMCGGQMNLHNDQMWMCYSCAYEELKKSEVQEKVEQKSEIPLSSSPQDTETKWQKKCPMCGGQMNLHNDQTWICYSCAFEESKAGEMKDKSEEKNEYAASQDPSSASEPISDISPSVADSLEPLSQNEYQKSLLSDNQPLPTKPCPVCHQKMNWHEPEKAWRCPFCEYERRI